MSDPATGKPYFVNDEDREFIAIAPNNNLPFVNFISGKKPIISPDEISPGDISEIIVGPACEFSEARVFVRKLLLENSFDLKKIEIRHAKFPYRA